MVAIDISRKAASQTISVPSEKGKTMDNTSEKMVELVNDVLRCLPWGEVSSHTAKDVVDHLIANGVTALPCKIGDVVWGIKKYNNAQKVKQGVVYQMFFGEDMRLCVCVKNVCRGEWGVNVFLTKDEAESNLPQPPKGD